MGQLLSEGSNQLQSKVPRGLPARNLCCVACVFEVPLVVTLDALRTASLCYPPSCERDWSVISWWFCWGCIVSWGLCFEFTSTSHVFSLLLCSVRNLISVSMKAKITAYVIALALHINNFQTDLTILQNDMKLQESRWVIMFVHTCWDMLWYSYREPLRGELCSLSGIWVVQRYLLASPSCCNWTLFDECLEAFFFFFGSPSAHKGGWLYISKFKRALVAKRSSGASRGSSAILQARKLRQAAPKWAARADSRTRPIHCHPAPFLAWQIASLFTFVSFLPLLPVELQSLSVTGVSTGLQLAATGKLETGFFLTIARWACSWCLHGGVPGPWNLPTLGLALRRLFLFLKYWWTWGFFSKASWGEVVGRIADHSNEIRICQLRVSEGERVENSLQNKLQGKPPLLC